MLSHIKGKMGSGLLEIEFKGEVSENQSQRFLLQQERSATRGSRSEYILLLQKTIQFNSKMKMPTKQWNLNSRKINTHKIEIMLACLCLNCSTSLHFSIYTLHSQVSSLINQLKVHWILPVSLLEFQGAFNVSTNIKHVLNINLIPDCMLISGPKHIFNS